jgi:hypothetical protein
VHATVGAAHLPLAWSTGELNHVLDLLAFGLEVDRVDIPGACHVHLAGRHRIFGADTAVDLGRELHVHAVFLVVAEILGEVVRQVDLFVDATDHDLHGRQRRAGAGVSTGGAGGGCGEG